MNASESTSDLIEVVARWLYERENPRRSWDAKSIPQHLRKLHHREAANHIKTEFGGEAKLFAFCEAVLATREWRRR
jgi:hypothetical protein